MALPSRRGETRMRRWDLIRTRVGAGHAERGRAGAVCTNILGRLLLHVRETHAGRIARLGTSVVRCGGRVNEEGVSELLLPCQMRSPHASRWMQRPITRSCLVVVLEKSM